MIGEEEEEEVFIGVNGREWVEEGVKDGELHETQLVVELVRDDCDDWEEVRDNDKDDVELREDGHLFDNIRQGRERERIYCLD